MTNPYEPPQQAAQNRLTELLIPGTYFGGFWGVTALGVLAGLLVALGIYLVADLRFVTPFIVPAVVWIGAFVVLLLMLRNSEIHPATRFLLPLLLTIPAYILYVPVCTVSAMVTTSFMGSKDYGPSFPGLVLASVVTFVLVLLLFAAILRLRFKQRVEPQDANAASIKPLSFSAPINEPSNE